MQPKSVSAIVARDLPSSLLVASSVGADAFVAYLRATATRPLRRRRATGRRLALVVVLARARARVLALHAARRFVLLLRPRFALAAHILRAPTPFLPETSTPSPASSSWHTSHQQQMEESIYNGTQLTRLGHCAWSEREWCYVHRAGHLLAVFQKPSSASHSRD